ncbi:MAG: hypothetical protein H0X39_18280 [Actinobacteria bacterium]|nr:hypothetical protein [Actinomycetota bacterium]
MGDVAADSGKTTNVFYSNSQYTDAGGAAAYSSIFGGSPVDANPFPANGCTDSYTSICLSDAQLRTEIEGRRHERAAPWPGHAVLHLYPKGGRQLLFEL